MEILLKSYHNDFELVLRKKSIKIVKNQLT
jgi:hypothetical protein